MTHFDEMNDMIGENLLDFKRPKFLNFLKAPIFYSILVMWWLDNFDK